MFDRVLDWHDTMYEEINSCNTLRDLLKMRKRLNTFYKDIIDYREAVNKGYSRLDMYFLINLLMRVNKSQLGVLFTDSKESLLLYVDTVTVFVNTYFKLIKQGVLNYTTVLQDIKDFTVNVDTCLYTGLLAEYVKRFEYKPYNAIFKVECQYQNFPKSFSEFATNLNVIFEPDGVIIQGYDKTPLVPKKEYAYYSLDLSDVL